MLYYYVKTVGFLWLQMLITDTMEDDNVSTKRSELRKKLETVVAPWVGYNEEETMKAQILALSKVFTGNCFVCVCVCHFSLVLL